MSRHISSDMGRGRNWLMHAIYRNEKERVLRAGYYLGLHALSSLLIPVILGRLIGFLGDPKQSTPAGLYLATLVLLVIVCRSFLQHHYFIEMQRSGIRAKGIVLDMAYKKVRKCFASDTPILTCSAL